MQKLMVELLVMNDISLYQLFFVVNNQLRGEYLCTSYNGSSHDEYSLVNNKK